MNVHIVTVLVSLGYVLAFTAGAIFGAVLERRRRR